MSDLRQRVPGHALIDELLHQWELGTIHRDEHTGAIVIDDEARGWYLGVVGERRIAALLDTLGEGFTVLHSVPAGSRGRDIDHVVIGPTGVFTINTKFHPERDIWSAGFGLTVNRHPQNSYVQAAMTELRQAEAALSRLSGLTVPVVGIIVFVDPRTVSRTAPAGDPKAGIDIRVLSDRELLGVLTGRRVLSDEQVSRIAEAAWHPDTWLRDPAPSSIGDHIAREFAALEEAVGPALAEPRVRATAPARPHATTRTRTRTKPRARTRTRRSTRSSAIQALLWPLAGLIAAWYWVTFVLGT